MKITKNLNIWLAISMLLLSMVSTAVAQTIYVDDDATGANNGSSWADAYNYLQDALTIASSGDEIRVAQGTYKPDRGGGKTLGDREATFQFINGVAIKGGFAGFGEVDPNERNIEAFKTILSGDIGGNDINDIDMFDPCDLLNHPSRAENSYHVTNGSGTDAAALLDGLIITGGNANLIYSTGTDGPYDDGGGMYNKCGSPTLINCTFVMNSAIYGGGMENTADNPTWPFPQPNPCSPGKPTLINCTFIRNSAYCGGAMLNGRSSPTLTNCILWGNLTPYGRPQIHSGYGTESVTYSNVQGGWPGIGNINADPLFVDPNSNDYHLKSEGWRYDTKRKVWTWDDVTSPCIDAGNPGSSLENELLSIPYDPDNQFGINLRINMGAYGGTPEASMAPRGWSLLADLSNDGIVNFVDLALQVQDWLTTANEQPGNLNRDAAVNMIDFAILAKDWLKRKPFVVKITKPENGTYFYHYETIEIEADAWCFCCSVVKVEFFANGTKIGEDNHGSDGWKTNWEGDHARGSYNLTTKATSDNGATTVSLAVAIRIDGGGPP